MPLGDAVDRSDVNASTISGFNPYPFWYGQGSLLNTGGGSSNPSDAPYDNAPPWAAYGNEADYNAAVAKQQALQGGDIPSSPPNSSMSPANSSNAPVAGPSSGASKGPGTYGNLNLPGMAISLFETIKGAQNTDALNKIPFPEYGVGSELKGAYSQAQDMAKQGFTPQERAAFMSQMNQGSATNAYNAQQQGGANLSNAIQGGLNAQNLSSFNQFAGQDANLHRQNIAYAGQMAGQMQNQENLKTQADIQRRNQQEQAFGGTLNAGIKGMGDSAQGGFTFGNLLNTVANIAMPGVGTALGAISGGSI